MEWVGRTSFLAADTRGGIQLHTWDLAQLTQQVRQSVHHFTQLVPPQVRNGDYEDKEQPNRTFNSHTFGVYQVLLTIIAPLKYLSESLLK